ncbi:MAG: tetratricopeptide repeat protein [Chlorobiaceae bacterium]|nr:tetratricopeptide repeat protein [Chlorobiaceae bacterium]NTV61337.1 tetratricopeptide repeat protein [Chlorobiaceae bacterium]
MSKYAGGTEPLEEALRQVPEEPEKMLDLALHHIACQRNAEAVELLDSCIALRPRHAAALYARAVANLSLNNYRKAGNDFLRVIVLDPRNVDAYRHLGFVQHTLGKEDAARKTIRKALAVDPDCAGLYCVLGDVHLDLCEFDAAKAAFDKALELAPDHAEPHCKIAMYYLSRGDMKGLKREYELLKSLDASMAEQIGSLFFS